MRANNDLARHDAGSAYPLALRRRVFTHSLAGALAPSNQTEGRHAMTCDHCKGSVALLVHEQGKRVCLSCSWQLAKAAK